MKKKIVYVVITLLLVGASSVFSYNYGFDQGTDLGRESGHSDGYSEGYDEGYTDGYDDAQWELGENDLSGYIGPAPDTTTYLTTETAPAGTVWTTPSGEKYHEAGCQYINGRNDLTYFLSSGDAVNAGYSPCSVCH